MPNPLKAWKHGRKTASASTVDLQSSIPLLMKPKESSRREGVWVSFVAHKLIHTTDHIPNMVGKYAYWDGDVYEVVEQDTLSHPDMIRKLEMHFELRGLHAFVRVFLEEADFLLALRGSTP